MPGFNFASDFASVGDSIISLSKRAHDALKSADDKRKQQADKIQALQSAEQEKAKADKSKATSKLVDISGLDIVANLVLDTEDPSAKDMAALADLSETDLAKLSTKIQEVVIQFRDIPKYMRIALRTSNFLDANDKTNSMLQTLTSEVDETKLPAIGSRMTKNGNYVLDFWREVITDFDTALFQRSFINTLKRISSENEKRNLAKPGTTSFLYTGSKLVELLRAQHQVIEKRLTILKKLVSAEIVNDSRPITDEHLSALKNLVSRL